MEVGTIFINNREAVRPGNISLHLEDILYYYIYIYIYIYI